MLIKKVWRFDGTCSDYEQAYYFKNYRLIYVILTTEMFFFFIIKLYLLKYNFFKTFVKTARVPSFILFYP